MGSQASRLMPCLFQDCGFAPEGGAPADGTWHACPGESDLSSNPARSAWHLVHGAFLLLLVGTPYHGTPQNSIRLARCKCGRVQLSAQPCSPSHLEPVIDRDIGLKPRRRTARAHSPAACGGFKPDSVRARHVERIGAAATGSGRTIPRLPSGTNPLKSYVSASGGV